MPMKDEMINASVTIRRNYADLPFDALTNNETAQDVTLRVTERLEKEEDTYTAMPGSKIDKTGRKTFSFLRLSGDDFEEAQNATLFVKKNAPLCIQAAAGDHIAVSYVCDPGGIGDALKECLTMADKLQEQYAYAESEEFGFLTARPADAGTGVRASMLLHLPMTQLARQIPAALKLSAEGGLLLRPMLQGMPGQTPALFVLENRVTMGIGEEEIVQRVIEKANMLIEKENALRGVARDEQDDNVLDLAYRAFGTAKYARKISQQECGQLWSALTLGFSIGLLCALPPQLDKLWSLAFDNQHDLKEAAANQHVSEDILRARRIRETINGGA